MGKNCNTRITVILYFQGSFKSAQFLFTLHDIVFEYGMFVKNRRAIEISIHYIQLNSERIFHILKKQSGISSYYGLMLVI